MNLYEKIWAPAVFAFVALMIVIVSLVSKPTPETPVDLLPSGVDPANTTYLIEGERILLTGGIHEAAADPNSSSTVRTAIFDTPVVGDLDGDDDKDMGLLLQRDMGGSGLFYYLAVALQNPDTTAQGLNAILVGDRIAPQSMQIKDGTVIFNYAERKSGEPMTTEPSVGVSLYAVVINGELVKTEGAQ
jgi:hypothetical protein